MSPKKKTPYAYEVPGWDEKSCPCCGSTETEINGSHPPQAIWTACKKCGLPFTDWAHFTKLRAPSYKKLWQESRVLIGRVITRYCADYRKMQAQIADLKQQVEACVAGGASLQRIDGRWIAKNKLANDKPTRVIRLVEGFAPETVRFTHHVFCSALPFVPIDGPGCVCTSLRKQATDLTTVPDATGDSSQKLPWTNKTADEVAAEWDVLL